MLERELLSEERELPSEERELLSDEVELEAELSDALCELVELVDSEVEIEQPTRRNSTGSSATRAGLSARWVPKEAARYVSAFADERARACATRTGWHVRVTPTLRGSE